MSATPNQVQISGQIQLADLDALKAAGIGTSSTTGPMVRRQTNLVPRS